MEIAARGGDARRRDYIVVQLGSLPVIKENSHQSTLSEIYGTLADIVPQLDGISTSDINPVKAAIMKMLEMPESHHLDDEIKHVLSKLESASKTQLLDTLLKDKFPNISRQLKAAAVEQQASTKKDKEISHSYKWQTEVFKLSIYIFVAMQYMLVLALVIRQQKHALTINSAALMVKAIMDVLLQWMSFCSAEKEKEFEDKKEVGTMMRANIISLSSKFRKMRTLIRKLSKNYRRLIEDIKLLLHSESVVEIKPIMKKLKKKCEVIESGIDLLKDKIDVCMEEISLALSFF